MEEQLLGSHQRTYDAVFQHPIARNLHWRDVRAMLTALADAADEPNGNLKLTRNGHTLVLHPPIRKDFSDVHELMKIRHFLAQSGAALTQPADDGKHLLVVIDHRLARIYKTEFRGSVPEQIVPYDASGSGRHLHYVQDDSNGQRRPEVKSFYEAVAKTLERAEKILLFGSGTGASSAMDQLLAELAQHHKELAKRVVGSLVVNEQHLTEDQLLAKAREFYGAPRAPEAQRAPEPEERAKS
jgi:hypothetical protein